jgi:hypothetical protein
MKRPTIFLNELSLTTDREIEPEELLPHVLATLKAARETKRLRRELIVVGGLTEVAFGVGCHTLPSLLRGADYREEWRSLKGLEQSSPYGQDDWSVPHELEEVNNPYLQAAHLKIDQSQNVVPRDIEVPNLAKPEHVGAHAELIRELGTDLSSSSIIHESEDFVLRMYFNDHDPPHFHVMAQHDSSETLARFRINTLAQLTQSARLRSALRRKIIDWAESRKDLLMQCWSDCRQHSHPARLD